MPFTDTPSADTIASIKGTLSSGPKIIEPQKSSGEKQAQIFLRANHFSQTNNLFHACQRFEYLSNDESFVLSRLAWVRSLKTCDYSIERCKAIWDLKDLDIPRWLKEEYIKTSLEIAKKLKSKKYTATFLKKVFAMKKLKRKIKSPKRVLIPSK